MTKKTETPQNSQELTRDEGFRSVCSLASTLDVIGDKWTLLIIRDLMLGVTTYSELQHRPESIPTNILASRLKRLQAMNLVEKKLYQTRPNRYQYMLTELGWSLKPVLLVMSKWGLDHVEGSWAPDVVLNEIAKLNLREDK